MRTIDILPHGRELTYSESVKLLVKMKICLLFYRKKHTLLPMQYKQWNRGRDQFPTNNNSEEGVKEQRNNEQTNGQAMEGTSKAC